MTVKIDSKRFVLGIVLGLTFILIIFGGINFDKKVLQSISSKFFGASPSILNQISNQKVVNEESVVTEVVDKVSPSVVTVSMKTPKRTVIQFSPFGGFQQGTQGGDQQDIGSGFVVSSDGLIITNKHVVSDTSSTYKVITNDNKEYDVAEINRDPSNDVAILKINASGLKPIDLGDSGNLKVGQMAIAIGTALGEFRHTVTVGVVSGLGRGITAGSVYEGYVERLDNVIQTDAAINPGNSGGPLLNSSGQVIGINVAVAQGAQNIGFAIPVNIVKNALGQYQESGRFPAKPFLGVRYQIISKQAAIMNDVPQGAYVSDVVAQSPAADAGITADDIITKIDGKAMTENFGISDALNGKKPQDKISVEYWRNGETKKVEVTLAESSS